MPYVYIIPHTYNVYYSHTAGVSADSPDAIGALNKNSPSPNKKSMAFPLVVFGEGAGGKATALIEKDSLNIFLA